MATGAIVFSPVSCSAPMVSIQSLSPNSQPTDSTPLPASPSLSSSPSQPDPTVSVSAAVAGAEAGADLWSLLQRADAHYFVLVRHALAPGTGDPANFRLEDCSTQRNLSDEGRAQARQLGEAFKQRGIVVAQVLSSQWCRCLETAKLMDLGTVQPFPPLNSFFADRTQESARTAQVREFARGYSNQPGVTVMVTHFVNISALSGVGVSSADMVVMRVNPQGQLELVGQLTAL